MGPNRGGGRQNRARGGGRGGSGSNSLKGDKGSKSSSHSKPSSTTGPSSKALSTTAAAQFDPGGAAGVDVVRLSPENQRLVEGLLQQLAGSNLGRLRAGSAAVAADVDREDVRGRVMTDLLKKGFSKRQVLAGIAATEPQAHLEGDLQYGFSDQKRRCQQRVLNHLILTLLDDDLPDAFRSRPARPVPTPEPQEASAVPGQGPNGRPANGKAATNSRQQAQAVVAAEEGGAELDAALALRAAGFAAEEAASAVAAACGSGQLALERLLQASRPAQVEAQAQTQMALGGGWRQGLDDMRQDEMLALEAILGPDAKNCQPGSRKVTLVVRADRVAGQGLLVADFELGCAYPFDLPSRLLYRNPALQFPASAAINAALAREAQQQLGEPFLHGLLTWLQENAAQVVKAAERAAEQLMSPPDEDAETLPAASASQGQSQALSRTKGRLAVKEQAEHAAEEARLQRIELLKQMMKGDPPPPSQPANISNGTAPPAAQPAKPPSSKTPTPRQKSAGPVKPVEPAANGKSMGEALRLQAEQLAAAGAAAAEAAEKAAAQAVQDGERRRLAAEATHLAELAARGEHDSRDMAHVLRQRNERTDAPAVAMREQRRRLPSWAARERVLQVLGGAQVVVVAGETGCGKTTQVPQFILDAATERGRGGYVNIVCTQPRRISATSVAQRVAAERLEQLGGTVGYTIRLESRRSASTRLLFCTTGVLLRRLIDDPTLVGVSHVLVDEVHERSLDSDFLLVLLRQLLPKRPDLKLVLMSATVNEAAFSAYFGGCPALTIPGFTHPVRELFLEDVLALTRYAPDPNGDYARKPQSGSSGRKGVMGAPNAALAAELQAIAALAGRGYSEAVVRGMRVLDQEKLNYELLVAALRWIVTAGEPGAVLVFMPGLMEITKLHEACRADGAINAATRGGAYLIALHSTLSSGHQATVFDRPPTGVRKIVIATNIAETSITIDDCVYVLDTGRVKENSYSAATHMQALTEGWVSRAAARQRRGRAGRTQPGTCFRLFSRYTHEAVMAEWQVPEILRVPLEGLALQIKLLGFEGGVAGFMGSALEAPSPEAVDAAVAALKRIRALDEGREALTPLGYHLANLPVDVRVGKMLLYGAILGCLDPVLTIAAAMTSRSPFVSPLDKREEADAARRSFAAHHSDHLAVLAAFTQWQAARAEGRASERAFCRDNFLSASALEGIADLRRQFRQLLREAGFLADSGPARRDGGRGGRSAGGGNRRSNGRALPQPQDEAAASPQVDPVNAHAGNLRLVKAVLCAGLYPNVVRAELPPPSSGAARGAAKPIKLLTQTGSGAEAKLESVQIHPCSVNFEATKFDSRWLVYHEKVQTSAVYLRDCSTVSPYALLLLGGRVRIQHAARTVTLENWIRFGCAPRTAVLLTELRSKLDLLLQEKIERPEVDIWRRGGAIINAILQLISTEQLTPK